MTDDERRELLEDVFTALSRCRVYSLGKRDANGNFVPVTGELGMSRSDLSRALAGLNGGVVPMPGEPRPPKAPQVQTFRALASQQSAMVAGFDELSLFKRVADELVNQELAASVEYPGYIQAAVEGGYWNFGTANGDWGGDKSTADGRDLGEGFVIPGTAGWSNPVRIAKALIDAISTKKEVDGK